MKHNVQITLILIGIFFLAQVIGLATLSQYIDEIDEMLLEGLKATSPWVLESLGVESQSPSISGAPRGGTSLSLKASSARSLDSGFKSSSIIFSTTE